MDHVGKHWSRRFQLKLLKKQCKNIITVKAIYESKSLLLVASRNNKSLQCCVVLVWLGMMVAMTAVFDQNSF